MRISFKNTKEYLKKTLSSVQTVSGSLVECGFGKGDTARILTSFVNSDDFQSREIWLFDSFEGFPELSEYDKSPRNAKKGDWKKPLDPALSLQNSSKAKVHVVKGFFEEVLPLEYSGDPIAFLHLDCDLYNSYKVALETLYEFVAPGGIVLFDEYKDPVDLKNWPGASKAIDEFFESRSISLNIEEAFMEDRQVSKYYHVKTYKIDSNT